MLPIPGTFTLQATLIAGAVALVVGLAGGGYAMHAWYAPQLEAEKSKVQSLGEKIKDQNDAIAALQDADKKRAADAAAKIKAARNAQAAAEADAQNLLMAQPLAGEDRCTAASRLIREELPK
jgi:hypothetical protein